MKGWIVNKLNVDDEVVFQIRVKVALITSVFCVDIVFINDVGRYPSQHLLEVITCSIQKGRVSR